MAAQRDLVEAHTFNRRRLVTAFVSGSADQTGPGRPVRIFVGGLALGVLLLVGISLRGAVAGGTHVGCTPPSGSSSYR